MYLLNLNPDGGGFVLMRLFRKQKSRKQTADVNKTRAVIPAILLKPNKLSSAYHDIACTSFLIRKGKAHCGPLYGMPGQRVAPVLFLLRQAAAHLEHPGSALAHVQSAFPWAPAFAHQSPEHLLPAEPEL
jgi:hypothetical protein